MTESGNRTGWWESRWAAAALLAVVAAVYLGIIGQYGFIGADEPRYARIAEEMMRRGDPVVPTYRGIPWLEKPPLLYWLAGMSYRVFGVNEFAARVPSVLATLGFLAVFYAVLHPVYGRRLAFFAVLTLSTCGMFVGYSGAATTDILISDTVGAGLLLLWRYLSDESPPPAWWLWAAAALFGLGCLAKGPLALVLPALVAYPYIALTGRVQGLTLTRLAAAAGIFLAISVPWYVAIYQAQGFKFILVFFINHHLARYVTDIHHHSRPFWYFVPVLLVGSLPWTAFLLFLRRVPELFRNRRMDIRAAGFWFFAVWLAVPFLFFSLSTAKLPGYILPLFPAFAFLAAWGIEQFVTDGTGRIRLLKWILFSSAVILLVAFPIFFHVRFDRMGLGLALDALVLPGLLLSGYLTGRNRRELAAAAVALSVFLPLAAGTPFVVPVLEPFFCHRQLCRQALQWTSPGNPLVIYRNFHYTNDYYSGYTCTDNLSERADLERYLQGRDGPVYVLTAVEGVPDFAALPGWRGVRLAAAGESELWKLERQP